MSYVVYIMQCRDGSLYTGITTDLKRRLQEHKNKKGGGYTRAHEVTKIAHAEKAQTRSEALKRESEIKSWPREKKLQLIKPKRNPVRRRRNTI